MALFAVLVGAGCGGGGAGGAATVHETEVPAHVAAGDTTVTVTGPTVIAFYHTDQPGVAAPSWVLDGTAQPGTRSEFDFNLPRQQSTLAAMGWHLVILYRTDFQAVAEDGTVLGRPEGGPSGYMVATPAGVVRTHYGVLATDELEQFVQESR
jgi:hypothetical protein